MANENHLALLGQGVEAWNEWKAKNPDIKPNLSFATGERITIRGAKLSGVDLSRANLSRADFSRADLIGAKLNEANLKEADLSETDLIGADLSSADLNGADLISANLIGTNLTGAYLSGADLSKANLSGADLVGAKLIGAKLSGANLSGAKLIGANLSGAHLSGAHLKGTNLSHANFSRANLSRANLQRTKALDTNFNKAILTGACLEDWHTNNATNLDDAICEYVYIKVNPQERLPGQGTFAPGEFTRLFQKTLETVELTFRNGIDWQAFFNSFQKLQAESGDSELSIQAMENKHNGGFVIRVNVPPNLSKTELKKYLKREYDSQLQAIDQEYRYQLQATYEQIAAYRQENANLTEIMKLLASRAIAVEAAVIPEQKYLPEATEGDRNGAQTGHLVNTVRGSNHQAAFLENYTPEQKSSLKDTAAKFHKLLQQLEQTCPSNTPLEKQMVVLEVIKRIESNPALKAWVREVLNGVSLEALKHLIDHPLANVFLAALEGYQRD